MDRNTFDGIARLLGGAWTRRAALGALLAGASFGAGFEPGAAANRRRRRRRRKRSNQPQVCYGANACPPPATGSDFDDCDFSGTEIFVDANAGGSSFRRANFADATMDGANLQGTLFRDANLRGASMVGVDVRGASFPGACLLDTDLTGHIFAEGETPFALAFACNTKVAPGVIVDRDCNRLPSCCSR
jgi:uncharacterized protein YjbI with pentapeptide repeats